MCVTSVTHLMHLNAWKHISPQLVQHLSKLARNDALVLTQTIINNLFPRHEISSDEIQQKLDAIMPTLRTAAMAGTQGRHSQNVGRSLGSIHQDIRFKHVTRISLPVKIPKTQLIKPIIHEVSLPHCTLAEMYDRFPKSFAARICPSPDRLAAFWSSVIHSPTKNGLTAVGA